VLFGDNDVDNNRGLGIQRLHKGGQAKVIGEYDRDFGYGICTTWLRGTLPTLSVFKTIMDCQFEPLKAHLAQGRDVIVPAPSKQDLRHSPVKYANIRHNLGTGIADLDDEYLLYIQTKLNCLGRYAAETKNISHPKMYSSLASVPVASAPVPSHDPRMTASEAVMGDRDVLNQLLKFYDYEAVLSAMEYIRNQPGGYGVGKPCQINEVKEYLDKAKQKTSVTKPVFSETDQVHTKQHQATGRMAEIHVTLPDNRKHQPLVRKFQFNEGVTLWQVHGHLKRWVSDLKSHGPFTIELANGQEVSLKEFDQTLAQAGLVPQGYIRVKHI